MKQELKTQKSIELILEAGLSCFSQSGYKATSMKDIARSADISVGRVYHHFNGKLEIFTALIERYWKHLEDPELPLNQVIRAARFPDDIAEIAAAVRHVVENNKAYIMLIYIDVIEFQGEHIRRFYHNMAANFKAVYGARFEALKAEGRLPPGSDPLFAVMMTVRFLFQYYLVETSFGVVDHFGFDADAVGEKVQQLVLHGLLNAPSPVASEERES